MPRPRKLVPRLRGNALEFRDVVPDDLVPVELCVLLADSMYYV